MSSLIHGRNPTCSGFFVVNLFIQWLLATVLIYFLSASFFLAMIKGIKGQPDYIKKRDRRKSSINKQRKQGENVEIHDQFNPGDVVYIIIRNPHAQNVAHVQQAAVVRDPERPDGLALFVYETYYPLTDEFAVFKTEQEAEAAYREAFGSLEMESGETSFISESGFGWE